MLGEAANLLSEDTKIRFPEVPWRNPARLRNRVVHAYWSIDIGVLHTTATEQLGDFVQQLHNVEAELRLDPRTETQ